MRPLLIRPKTALRQLKDGFIFHLIHSLTESFYAFNSGSHQKIQDTEKYFQFFLAVKVIDLTCDRHCCFQFSAI